MDKILTKYFWVVNVFALAVSAYLLAGGTGELVANKLSSMLPPVEGKPDTEKQYRPKAIRIADDVRDGSAIWKRNIFDSVIGPIDPNEDSDIENPVEVPTSSPGGLPVVPCSSSNVKLFATVASQTDPNWSFASIAENGQNKLCRIGDTVDGRTVSRIFWSYLFLKGTSDECFVSLFDEGMPTLPPSQGMNRPMGGPQEEIANGIHYVSETERVVDRAVVDKLISNPSQFIRSVRVRPYRQDGKVVGFKIRRFTEDSPLAMLGAQRGDIIHAVNGIELNSVDQALGAYQNLRTSGRLTFSITRMGKPMELTVGIR